ncbi:phosphomannomutase [Devosia sp. XJ19-1]|uniref:Phosphomannomutase n=1 Tax=Devosia ureilytica TaxID=2952754 RepID=A0A9Q4ALF2_9HYPH|nr:phosphomannomutase [Devosia ureilytica]MCP8881895.1 phosphomannomutase [Devosia ureilytica]MCP8886219.1 phosphomannomutase [Devosia ureilytica]
MALGNSLKFGTSGLRGLAVELEGQAARQYTAAFLRHLAQIANAPVRRVFLGRDFRPSSAAILGDCAVAIAAAGLEPVDCGLIPTPALALHAQAQGGAAIMVTGSHIPADRNGLKFYLPTGEISKADEQGIVAALDGAHVEDHAVTLRDDSEAATARYLDRFASLLGKGALAGMRVGVFEHSTVARDLLATILEHCGAEVVRLGRIDGFVPVDTEAFSDPVFAPLSGWIGEHRLDAIVSADGDGDRPLLMDNRGAFVRGDVLGLLAARYLGAQVVVTPVTSNSAIELTGYFETVVRTRVGSPFVVAAMDTADGAVVGFEANGGTFVGKGVVVQDRPLPALATRDAILPVLCLLGDAATQHKTVSQVCADIPLQHALADRLQDVPGERSAAFLERLAADAEYAATVFEPHGITRTAAIDGLQFWTRSGDMVHFRASGNAPELRCYVEAQTAENAGALLIWGLETAAREVGHKA